jgi:putative ABC transport system ATP-binding protein
VVKLVGVCKEYHRDGARVLALDEVSFEIDQSEFCALVGPSGCGKSTLLNLIGGMDRPTRGEIFLGGEATGSLTDQEWTRIRRHEIGFVFQAFHLVPGLSAAENVALPLLLAGMRGSELKGRVDEFLDAVHMSHRWRHRPGQLSGGEQQRVAIARALVHRPHLILADEPTGNLDSVNGAEVIALLTDLTRSSGQTVIMATHSEGAVVVADRILTMKDGRIEAVTRPDRPADKST